MIWLGALDAIYVLCADGNSPAWEWHSDTWEEGQPLPDPTPGPPAGLRAPERGFGKVWWEQPGVRQRPGRALAPETGFEGAFQRDSAPKYSSFYLRAADGRVILLRPERSGWQYLAG
ncbi:MAG: hypothetical protein HY784_12800 [Chloroflexi bacterium]|nr:hypothetical protein [Chloroflexota bacterium]